MATFDLPELPETRVSPQLMLGAVSPLWAYFGAAAAGGVAYWWMTRWTRPVNLEALFRGQAAALAPMIEAAAEPVVEAVETMAATAAVAETLPDAPVGGEAAPISPVVEALAAPEPEPAPDPSIEAALERGTEAVPEPLVETPPMMEATADPLPEPAAKPRVRKTPPANGLEA